MSDAPLRSHTHKVEQGLGVLALRIKPLLLFGKIWQFKGGREETISFLLALSNCRA